MTPSALTVSTDPTGSKIAVVQLRELDCQGCADNIRSTIGNFDGVHSVRASMETKQVTVEYEFPFTEQVLVRQLQFAHFELAEPAPQLQIVEDILKAVPA